ncbi:MAG: AAA family ATPase [Solirubrobacterales bacterium]
MTESRSVLILTGPPGAGKTTAAGVLAQRFGPGVHLRSDFFFDFVSSEFVEPWRPESQRQNEVVMRTVGEAAASYARGGYFTVVDGIVIPHRFLATVRDAIAADGHEVAYAVLRAPLSTCVARVAEREGPELVDPAVVEQLWDEFADLGEYGAHAVAVDSSTPAEVADALARRLVAGELTI